MLWLYGSVIFHYRVECHRVRRSLSSPLNAVSDLEASWASRLFKLIFVTLGQTYGKKLLILIVVILWITSKRVSITDLGRQISWTTKWNSLERLVIGWRKLSPAFVSERVSCALALTTSAASCCLVLADQTFALDIDDRVVVPISISCLNDYSVTTSIGPIRGAWSAVSQYDTIVVYRPNSNRWAHYLDLVRQSWYAWQRLCFLVATFAFLIDYISWWWFSYMVICCVIVSVNTLLRSWCLLLWRVS